MADSKIEDDPNTPEQANISLRQFSVRPALGAYPTPNTVRAKQR
jgi:hypothetical protein